MEDSKQLILEGQHHVVLRTIGKEAFSYPQKQVMTCFRASCELVGGVCLIVLRFRRCLISSSFYTEI